MPVELVNRYLRLRLSDRGLLQQIDDLDAGAGWAVAHDGWTLEVGGELIEQSDAVEVASEAVDGGHRWQFQVGAHTVALHYELGPSARYVRRRLRLVTAAPTTLTRVGYGPLVLARPPAQVVRYDTFRDCPTVTFLRWDDGRGLFLGIACPTFDTDVAPGSHLTAITQRYDPGVVLAAGELYVGDAQAIGLVQSTGETVVAEPPRSRVSNGEPWRRGRFRNPMGHMPIDRGEVTAMRAYVADFLAPLPARFRSILYTYWYPLPQPPLDADAESRWKEVIDTFADLGGDVLLTTPLVRSRLPDATHDGYWDVAPVGSVAERVMDHARERGIGVALYMGVAAGNLEHGNAAALDYPAGAPDAWKKVGEDGTISGENCMASDAFLDWSVRVQANTIERFGLAGWSWDPGPGNGRFCHATGHGHLPGEGDHRGWRNATEVRRRLKERFPDLYLQAFYGQKEDGPWGLQHFDQHEAYWEQQVEWGASIHPDLSSDRMNADGVRLQAWWAQTFRFLPTALNHALVGRITQYCMDDPTLSVPWDHAGWRYALLSGLAAGGSITATILPDDLDSVVGMRETYSAWLSWARRHEALIDRDIVLGAQVRPGGVDIHARIDGRAGILFLANPGPRPATTRLPLGPDIGLHQPGRYRLVVQTPDRGPCLAGADGSPDMVAPGDVTVEVPAHTVLVLALEPADGPSGEVIHSADLRGPTLGIDSWVRDSGEPWSWPAHRSEQKLRINTTVAVDDGALSRIRHRRSRDADAVSRVAARQRACGFPDTFAWARPDRLLLIVPFLDPDRVGDVALQVDGRPVTMERFLVGPPGDTRLSGEPLPGLLPPTTVCWWADLTDVLRERREHRIQLDIDDLPADQFLGPWLEAPGARWDLEAPGIHPAARDPLVVRPSWSGAVPDGALPSIASDRTADVLPRVVRAWFEPPMLRSGVPVTIRAELDAPDSQVAGVFCSTLVGPGVFTDVALRPDAGGTWSHTFLVGDRRDVILDPAASRVWAVAKDGQPSAAVVVPMRWTMEARRAVHGLTTANSSGRDG